MKINAKVTFRNRKEAESLICALYDLMQSQKQEEHELSGKVEVVYEDILPDDTATISQESSKETCQQATFVVPATEVEETEVSKPVTEAEKSMPVGENAGNGETVETAPATDKLPIEESKATKTIKQQVYEIVDTCELEDALDKLVALFGITGKKQKEVFTEGIKAGVRIGSFIWTIIGKELTNNGIQSYVSNKNAVSSKITEKFVGSSEKLSLSKLTEYIVKKYSNKAEQTEQQSSPKKEEGTEGTTPVAEEKNEAIAMMEFMEGITSFEEMLNSIDESMTVEEKVEKVLEELGVQSLAEAEHEGVKRFLTKAVEMEGEISYTSISEQWDLPGLDADVAGLNLSKLINDYAMKHGKGRKIKSVEFCKQLKAAIFSQR